MASLNKYLWTGLLLIILLGSGCSDQKDETLESVFRHRPTGANLVYDEVGIMDDLLESTEQSLVALGERYDIEMMIVALPSLEKRYTISEAASLLQSQWEVGRNASGGVLLLLINDSREVKLEVSYELESIYTDLFTGSIERHQLGPRFVSGELEIGLIALMEELEARAALKRQEIDVGDVIAKRDAQYLSGGGGAKITLQQPVQVDFGTGINAHYPAGETVVQAWNSLLKRWQDGQHDPNLEVFLPSGRLAYRDFTTMPKDKLLKQYQTYRKKQYTIRQDGDYAVIFFGNKKGWDNAPFLFCRTAEGWQFDLVHQRRFIRMGPSPTWGVEFGEHPYMELLWDTFRFYGQDIYFSDEDRYQVAQDGEIAGEILRLEQEVKGSPQKFTTFLKLGRLYAITSMSRKAMKTLNKAAQLKPDNPEVQSYLALAHVNGVYQYESALKALNKAVANGGANLFTANLTGYIHYRQKRYAQAARAFEQGLALQKNGYGYSYLAFTYAWLVQQEKDKQKKGEYRNLYNHYSKVMMSNPDIHPIRLKRYLEWKEN